MGKPYLWSLNVGINNLDWFWIKIWYKETYWYWTINKFWKIESDTF